MLKILKIARYPGDPKNFGGGIIKKVGGGIVEMGGGKLFFCHIFPVMEGSCAKVPKARPQSMRLQKCAKKTMLRLRICCKEVRCFFVMDNGIP